MLHAQDKPVIVQSDKTLLLEVHAQEFAQARDDIAPFSELIKSPEHFHTYRLTPLSLWNASSAGITCEKVISRLNRWSKYPVPQSIEHFIRDTASRYGMLYLSEGPDGQTLCLNCTSDLLYQQLLHYPVLKKLLTPVGGRVFHLHLLHRGQIKIHLIKLGYPVEDLVPLSKGAHHPITLRSVTASGREFSLRDYQYEAVQAFLGQQQPSPGLGYGTVVMPCGSGKTVIGIGIMERLKTQTLIITTNTAAVHQWIDELLDKTTVAESDIGEYTGARKEMRPITVCTYQILTWRPDRESDFPHFKLVTEHDWGLIIYDEVHLLPAPVFKVTSEIQAVMRLGMTATLVREDHREDEVFSLIGPKRYDIPWKELEQKGWIAEAVCTEIRLPLPEHLEIPYAVAGRAEKFRIASENPNKKTAVAQIIENHQEDHILVIGQYIRQLKELAEVLHAPLITGKVANAKREELYAQFRKGDIHVLVVSKVANFAIDLPDASVAIQVSGTFGSRQEEAQRLGRILRPKKRNAHFYNLVTRFTSEEQFAANRQHFLTEQGYQYQMEMWDG